MKVGQIYQQMVGHFYPSDKMWSRNVIITEIKMEHGHKIITFQMITKPMYNQFISAESKDFLERYSCLSEIREEKLNIILNELHKCK